MPIQRFSSLLVLLFVFGLLNACSKGDEVTAWQKINQGALLLDVRSRSEHDAGHLPNSMLIPIDELPSRMDELGDNKDQSIVVYCKSGVRSGRAKDLLELNGFTDVINGGGYLGLVRSKP